MMANVFSTFDLPTGSSNKGEIMTVRDFAVDKSAVRLNFSPINFITRATAIVIVLASILLGTASLASAAAIATPTVSHASSGNIQVTFVADGVATSYTATSSPGGLTCVNAAVTPPTGSQSCVVSGLSPTTSYTFTVTPSGNGTTSTVSPASAAIFPGVAIAQPAVYNAGLAGIGVSFSADGVATTYTVNSDSGGFTCVVSNTTTPPTGTQFCIVPGVSGAHTYTVTPSGGGTSSFVSSASASISPSATLSAPTVANAGSGAIKVTFFADGVATNYTVTSTGGSFVCTVVDTTTPPAGPQSCTVTGLTNGTGYTFAVTPAGNATTSTVSANSASITPTAAIAAPTVAVAGAGAVKVSFIADGVSTLYTVTSTPGSFTCSIANTTTPPTGAQSCTVSGLSGSTSYSFSVTASGGSYGSNTSPASTSITTLSPIVVQTPTSASSGSVTVHFTSDGVATTYLVNSFAGSSTTAGAQTCTLTNTTAITAGAQSCTVTGLTNGTSYTFTVTPSGNGTTSTVSANTSAITPGAVLAAPTVATAGSGAIKVSFVADGVATLYTVTSYLQPGNTLVAFTCVIGNTATPPTGAQSCTVTGLTDTSSYKFLVTPTGNSTASTASAESAAITVSAALATPTASNAGTGAIKVSFVADGTATLYTVTSTPGSFTCTVSNTTTPPTVAQSCTVTGLTNGTSYTFTVTPSGNGTTSTVSAASTALYAGVNFLAAPTVAYATSTATVGAALVSFAADGTASTYTVQAYVNGVAAAGLTCTVVNSTTPPTGAQSCTVNGLTLGTQYTFTVTPSGNGTTSLISAQSVGYVAATSVVPSAPATATATGAKGSVVVSWTAPANIGGSAITGYVVTATAGSASNTCGTVAPTATTCTITGLSAATAYSISVVAVNAIGNSAAATTTATTTGSVVVVCAQPKITGVNGFVRIGHIRALTITGNCFTRGLKIVSMRGTTWKVIAVSAHAIRVHVSATKASRNGWHRLTLKNPNGKKTSRIYQQK
jgi:hypothetical protein